MISERGVFSESRLEPRPHMSVAAAVIAGSS